MNSKALTRAFRRLVAASMPLSGAAVFTACGGHTSSNVPQNELNQPVDDAGSGADGSFSDAGGNDGAISFSDAGGDDGAISFSDAAGDDGAISLLDADNGTDGQIVTTCGETVTVPTTGPFAGSLCGIAQCFPFDAAALDPLDGAAGWDGGPLSASQCGAVCEGTQGWASCAPFEDSGVSRVRCQPYLCTGRRPAGLVSSDAAEGTLLGAHFAEMARLEAASVHAFRHLRRELVEHGAPRRLVRAAGRAARDEIQHARATAALARRYGGLAVAPHVEPGPVRDLEAMALENAVEGCTREAFGALVATWQAAAARDPVIRAAMARIAFDETRHAALAFEIDAWLRARLDAPARARVAHARRAASAQLAEGLTEAPAAFRAPLGLPSRLQSRALADAMERLAA